MDINQLLDLYNKYEKVALVLVTALTTWLFTKLIPFIGNIISKVYDKAIFKIGGKLTYHNIQGKYLNWVVLHNQDLNLTGIIGAGQKPKLEQVFISLKVSQGISQKAKEAKKTSSNLVLAWENIKSQTKIATSSITNKIKEILDKYIHEPDYLIFKASKIWKINLLLERGYMTKLVFVLTIIIIPSIFLFIQNLKENLASSFIYYLLILLIAWGSTIYQEDNDTSALVLLCISPILIIAVKIIIFVNASTFPKFFLFGLFMGVVTILYSRRDNILNTTSKNERQAKEIGDLIITADTIAILGKPGSGKSTLSQFIALTFAQEKASNSKLRKSGIVKRRFELTKWYLPILIPLRKVSKHINVANIHSEQNLCIEAFRQEVLPFELRGMLSHEFIRYYLRKNKCVILLDGLDEVSNEDHFKVIINEIQGLVSQYSGNKFIITSRHAGWRGGVGSSFEETEVNELSNNQISVFARSWYKAIEINRQATTTNVDNQEDQYRQNRATKKAEQLIDTIDENENIRNLARNPLLLSMICYVHYNKTLPKERLSLYEDCSRLLLEQWDIEKSLPQDDIPLNLTRKEIIMQEIAFMLHNGKGEGNNGTREVSGDEILAIIKKSLILFNQNPDEAESIFKKLVERTGIIISTEQYKNLYGFSHLTFQEYFAAKYLIRHNINIFSEIEKSEFENKDGFLSWWREVVILYSDMSKDISNIIGYLCLNSDKDFTKGGLQIAAQCLIESTEHPNNKQTLLRELLKIRTNGASYPNSAINLDGEKYLINFALNQDYYFHVLLTKAENTDSDMIFDLSSTLASSIDKNIQKATLNAAIKTMEKNKFNFPLSQTDLELMFSQNGVTTGLRELLKTVINRNVNNAEEITEKLLDSIESTCIKDFCEILLRNYKDPIHNSDKFYQMLELLTNKVFSRRHPKMIEKSISTLREIISDLPVYASTSRLHKQELRDYIIGLMRFTQAIKGGQTRDEFKNEFLDMLVKGTPTQQSWAVIILSELFPGDQNIRKSIIEKFESPYAEVRYSALLTLWSFDLDKLEKDNLTQKFLSALEENTFVQRLYALNMETFFGKGRLGIEATEKILIAGWLATIDNKYKIVDLLKIKSSNDIYKYRYIWVELLSKISNELSNSEDLLKITEYIIELISNPENKVQFIFDLVSGNYELDDALKGKIIYYLFRRKDEGVMDILSSLEPEIEEGSEEYQIVKNNLSSEYYNDANGAFELLQSNNLLNNAIFETND